MITKFKKSISLFLTVCILALMLINVSATELSEPVTDSETGINTNSNLIENDEQLYFSNNPTVIVENDDYYIQNTTDAQTESINNNGPRSTTYYTGLASGFYIIESMYNGRYFHHTSTNETLNVWSYSEKEYQKWYVKFNSYNSSYSFYPVDNSEIAAEIYDAIYENGTPITFGSYEIGDLSDSYKFHLVQNPNGTISIISAMGPPNKALEVYSGPEEYVQVGQRVFLMNPNMTVQINTYDNSNIRQQWSFQELNMDPEYGNDLVAYHYVIPIQTGYYFVENKLNNRYLTRSYENNITAVFPPYGGTRQQWYIKKNSDNTYSFRLRQNDSLFLELYNGVNADGQPITVYNYTGNQNSPYIKFRMRTYGNGYAIVPLCSPTRTLGVFTGTTSDYLINGELIPKVNSETIELQPWSNIVSLNKQFYFYKVIDSNVVRFVAPRETITLDDLSLSANLYSGSNFQQVIKWVSSDPSVVSVDFTTGDITGKSHGTAYIRGTDGHGSSFFSYLVHVLELPEGTYSIKSKKTNMYLDFDVDEDNIMCISYFDDNTNQQWVLSHYSGRYYTIKLNVNSSVKYMGVFNGSSESTYVPKLSNGIVTDEVLWRIERANDSDYKLIPKSLEAQNYSLFGDDYGYVPAVNDTACDIGVYINDSNYKDEWNFVLLGNNDYLNMYIGAYEGDDRMPSILSEVRNRYMTYGFFGNDLTCLTKNEFLLHFKESTVFSCITHGCPEFIKLSNNTFYNPEDYEHIDDNKLTVSDINNMSVSDLARLKVACICACETGKEVAGETNFLHALYNKGVDFVVGFKDEVYVNEGNLWTKEFVKRFAAGYTAQEAMDYADGIVMLSGIQQSTGASDRCCLGSTSYTIND